MLKLLLLGGIELDFVRIRLVGCPQEEFAVTNSAYSAHSASLLHLLEIERGAEMGRPGDSALLVRKGSQLVRALLTSFVTTKLASHKTKRIIVSINMTYHAWV